MVSERWTRERLHPDLERADCLLVEAETLRTPTRDPRGSAAAPSLIVVDDDRFIARLLEIELTEAGYDVRSANDGERAFELARERCPELVLADVMMPNMDGFELTRRLREDARTSSTKVILLTARGLSADRLAGFSVGADDYIVKPFDTPELLARIADVLASPPARGRDATAAT